MAEPRLSVYGRATLGCGASDFLCSWIAGVSYFLVGWHYNVGVTIF